MKILLILFCLILFSNGVFAQIPAGVPAAKAKTGGSVGGENESFERAVAQTDAAARIVLLQKFAADFPKSADKKRALELVAGARAEIADKKLRGGDAAGGIRLFKLALKDAPAPVSDKLFADVLLRIPTNLFFGGEREAASEFAVALEKKIDGSARQLLGLATFYFGVENAEQAKRLAEKAAAIEPNLPAAYQTLGFAARLNFNLEDAAAAYSKALELDAGSVVSKRSLAEMKRAAGKSDEAAALYREILTANAADNQARSGLILALFDAGKRGEAEAELQQSLAQNPNNLLLLAGAAYWYAAHDGGAARAVELAERAVAVEPRYVWSYIALARGLTAQNRFYDAERALLAARAFGNFPTLDYELAAVRLAAGFYREAAQELAKSFTVKNNAISTKLGGRVEKQAVDFTELLALERRAVTFAPAAADNAESAERLKSLLDFYQKLEAAKTAGDDAEISKAADKFVEGAGKTRLHRRLFAANLLLEKNRELPKATDLMKNAAAEVDEALDAPNAPSAILAEQLYESRAEAARRNRIVIVPDVPRQTLSNIVRGRIEEIGGSLLLQANEPAAVVRLKRAVSILPEKSAWWRSSQWRLGAALEADGKTPAAALDAYVKSYAGGDVRKSAAKRAVIETLYRRINGNLDNLDALIGAKTAEETASDNPSGKVEKQNPATDDKVVPVNKQSGADKSPTTEISAETAATTNAKTVDSPTEIDATETKSPEIKSSQITKTKTTEKKPAAKKSAPEKAASVKSDAAKKAAAAQNSGNENSVVKSEKPLFEPIIINVPKTETTKTANRSDAANEARPRTVSGGETEIKLCRISVSQETVSLLNNGGKLSVLVGFEDDGGVVVPQSAGDVGRIIAATSSDAQAVEAIFELENGAPRQQSGRAVFIIKSVSRKTGVFTVAFAAPSCETKKIVVKVR